MALSFWLDFYVQVFLFLSSLDLMHVKQFTKELVVPLLGYHFFKILLLFLFSHLAWFVAILITLGVVVNDILISSILSRFKTLTSKYQSLFGGATILFVVLLIDKGIVSRWNLIGVFLRYRHRTV